MSKLKDLTGQRFGRLSVIERAENSNAGKSRWKCLCDCGNETIVQSAHLISGHTQSCGCLNGQNHGMYGSRYYILWIAIKNRCLNPNFKYYKNYGGRGITICDEWRNDFKSFYDYVSQLEHFGEEGLTLDRINNNGNYEPDNLRWADKKTQSENKRTNIIVEYDGKKITLKESSKKSGINYGTLKSRYHAGDRGDKLFRPVKHYNRRAELVFRRTF